MRAFLILPLAMVALAEAAPPLLPERVPDDPLIVEEHGKEPAEKGAREVVATQVHELGDTWGKKNPRGTVKLPAARLKAHGTVYLPPRVGLTGPRDELVVQDLWGLYAQEGFEKGNSFLDQFVLATRRANEDNANSNFDSRIENLMIQCRPGHAPSGILFSGAQISNLRNVCIWDAERYALYLDRGGSRIDMGSINIRNGNSSKSRTKTFGKDREPRGAGIKMVACRGVSGTNIAMHLCEVGFDLYGTHCVSISNSMLEKVDLILRAEGSSVIELRGLDIQASGRGEYSEGYEWHGILFDLRKHQGQIEITGRVRDTPSPVFYLDKDGVKTLLLATGTDSASGRPFKLEIN